MSQPEHSNAVLDRVAQMVRPAPLRVSVSDVEQFRYYKTHDFVSLDSLISQIRREQEPTEDMAVGTAFHTILETQQGEFEFIEQDGFTFEFALDDEVSIPDIKELKVARAYEGCVLVGKVDAMQGRTVYDHKATKNLSDLTTYTDSFQWRAYLDIFSCDKFVYNLFERYHVKKANVHRIKSFQPLPLYRYPKLESDVKRSINEYLEFHQRYVA